jgi:hypothetical protein
MKTKINFLILFSVMIINQMNAQVSTQFNNGFASDYVGWDVNQPFPLTIKHERANQPINLQTNTGAGGLAKIRMQISNTTVNAPNGASFEVGRVLFKENPLNAEATTKN